MADRTGYSRGQIALHWAIAVLIFGNYFFSDGMEQSFDGMMENGTLPDLSANLHIYAGIAVLVLVVVRLGLRFVRGVPVAPKTTVMDKLGTAAHWALYGLMLAVPVLGMTAWFGGVDQAAGIHALAANGIMALVLLHSLAALFHQYVLKDGLLRRMMRAE